MSLTQIGLLFIFFSNMWVLYTLKKTWYSPSKEEKIPVSIDRKGNIKIEDSE